MKSEKACLPSPRIEIDGRPIGIEHPPYVVAELSANHNGRLESALRLVDEAKRSGADAVKLQTYTPETMTLDCKRADFVIHGGLWDGRTLFDLYREAYLPWEWHAAIFDHGKRIGITVFSSPFDSSAVDLLAGLDAPAYKIASFELVDPHLIKHAAQRGKPLIMSTGLASAEEIAEAVEVARSAGCEQLALLHCVSGYPAPPEDYNLKTIPDLIERFGLVTGLSDHTLDTAVAVASVGLGACIVEKHFTLNRNGGSPDDSFSLEPVEFAALCKDVRTAWRAIGSANYTLKPSERGNAQFRRSLYFVKDLIQGEKVSREAVRSIRPGFGLPPRYIEAVVGKTVKCDLPAGTAVSWALLE
jgi:N-acetylneuraminate synthase